jgi:RimJ/RimL family protein N-acetyltransferase
VLRIATRRLALVPLRVEDADELVTVLADESLHEFVGGRPDTLEELRDRYSRFVAGSSSADETWLNWIVRRAADGQPLGIVQATLSIHAGQRRAHVAWVTGTDWQGQGFASEAAQALVSWLRDIGIETVIAHIHPDHRASQIVAERVGLVPTGERVDGEQVWRSVESA